MSIGLSMHACLLCMHPNDDEDDDDGDYDGDEDDDEWS